MWAAQLAAPPTARAITSNSTTAPSDVGGGGDVNTIAWESGGVLAAGSDVGGVSISGDVSTSPVFSPASAGLAPDQYTEPQDLHVASLFYNGGSSGDDDLYAISGNGTSTGESDLLQYDSSTSSWTHLNYSADTWSPAFTTDGTNGDDLLSGGWGSHPRPVGHLIDAGDSGANLYVASVSGMLSRVGSTGTWHLLGAPSSTDWASSSVGDVPTGFAADPNNTGHGWVTVEEPLSSSNSTQQGNDQGLWYLRNLKNTSGNFGDCQITSGTNQPTNLVPQGVVAITEPTSQSVVFVVGDAYGGGTAGLWQFTPSSTPCTSGSQGTWVRLDSQIPSGEDDCTDWSSVDAFYGSASSQANVWATCTTQQPMNGTATNEVWRLRVDTSGTLCTQTGCAVGTSNNGGTVYQTVDGESFNWWHVDSGVSSPVTSNPNVNLGQYQAIPEQIAIDPNDHNDVAVAGRAGVWLTSGTTNGGTTNSPHWYPMVAGLSGTVDHMIVPNPSDDTELVDADTDWTTLVGKNDFSGHEPVSETLSGNNQAFADSIDTAFSTPVLFAAGGDSTPNPWVEYNATPFASSWGSWYDLPLPTSGTNLPSGENVIGMVSGEDNSSNIVVLAVSADASANGYGLYQWTCPTTSWPTCSSSTWTNVTPSGYRIGNHDGTAAQKDHLDFWWGLTSGSCTSSCTYEPDVYLYDPTNGLFVSTNYGASWSLAWDEPDNTGLRASHSGDLTGDPNNPNRLYLSVESSVYRIGDGTKCGGDCGTSNLCGSGGTSACVDAISKQTGPPLTEAAAIAVDPSGYLWVSQMSESGGNTALYRSEGTTGPSGLLIDAYSSATIGGSGGTGDPGYVNQALEPNGLTVTHDGSNNCWAYLALDGDGIAVVDTGLTC